MDRDLLSSIPFCKRLPTALYVHRDVALPAQLASTIERAQQAAQTSPSCYDVIKFSTTDHRLSFLSYPGFWTEAFPTLAQSWAVDGSRVTHRDYREHWNPPVLHRKEFLLRPDHPARAEFEALTAAAEDAGLFADPSSIGQLLQWRETLRARGVGVVGHALVPYDASAAAERDDELVFRHRTALRRVGLSTPMQALLRHGFLDSQLSVLDYGCGHGDDLATLEEMGVRASGWDPYFRTDADRSEADVVNLGFVLNVIENLVERREALENAYRLARKVLVVGVLIGGRTAYERYRLFRDGVLTSRGTFQKYFTPDELHFYLETVCGRQPIPIAPGIAFVFRANEDEQAFLAVRQSASQTWLQPVPRRPPRAPGAARLKAVPRVRTPRAKQPKSPSRWEATRPAWTAFHATSTALGRLPEPEEFPGYEVIAALGRPETVLRKAISELGDSAFNKTRRVRMDDLLVYLALNLFERRRSFGHLPKALKYDIKAFWGTCATATHAAKALLFSVGKPETLVAAARVASNEGYGYLAEDDAFLFVPDVLHRVPRELRTFVGCAARLYGDAAEADLVKVHARTLKLTMHMYDDFEESPLPTLIERIKIDLRRQDILFVDYSANEEQQLLFGKSRYLPRDAPERAAQEVIDERLRSLNYLDLSGYGPTRSELLRLLAEHGHSLDAITRIEP